MSFLGFKLMFIVAFSTWPQIILSQNVVSGAQIPQFGPQGGQSNPQTVETNPQNSANQSNGQFVPQNQGQQNVVQNGQSFNNQQQVQGSPSPWAGITNILSQIPMGTLIQLFMSFVQNTPIVKILNGIFGKSFVIFQILSVSYSIFAAISLLSPTTGQYLQQQIGSITDAVAPAMYNLPETIRASQPFNSAMNMVGINQPDCQLRAACEAGQLVSRNYPTAAHIINLFGNALPIEDKYNQPFLRGTSNVNCAAAFRTCQQSPFQTMFNFGDSNVNQNEIPRRR